MSAASKRPTRVQVRRALALRRPPLIDGWSPREHVSRRALLVGHCFRRTEAAAALVGAAMAPLSLCNRRVPSSILSLSLSLSLVGLSRVAGLSAEFGRFVGRSSLIYSFVA